MQFLTRKLTRDGERHNLSFWQPQELLKHFGWPFLIPKCVFICSLSEEETEKREAANLDIERRSRRSLQYKASAPFHLLHSLKDYNGQGDIKRFLQIRIAKKNQKTSEKVTYYCSYITISMSNLQKTPEHFNVWCQFSISQKLSV